MVREGTAAVKAVPEAVPMVLRRRVPVARRVHRLVVLMARHHHRPARIRR